jgi:hypothetical protein
MKHSKSNRYASTNIEFLHTIIDGLNDRNQELESEVERLRNEIAETNDVNIQQDAKEQDYKNLVQLHTLLIVIMNLVTAHCDNSLLGQSVGMAIKRYLITILKTLANGTRFNNDKDKADWVDEDDEEFEEDEWCENEDEFHQE